MLTEISISFSPILNFGFLDQAVYSVNLPAGSFLLEVWGGSGGDTRGGSNNDIHSYGGRGGYSRGIVELNEGAMLYVYVGGSSSSQITDNPENSKGGFNGGGDSIGRSSSYGGGAGGGGSTDICTIKSEFVQSDGHLIRNYDSYQSRIIVAGGGGGSFGLKQDNSVRIISYGGYGGGVNSQGSGYNQSYGCNSSICDSLNQGGIGSHSYNYVTGSNLFSTGSVGCASDSNSHMNGANPGYFGYGGKSTKSSGSACGGGGGGGWFGGYSGTSGSSTRGIGGAGGSGYVHNNSNPYSNLGTSFVLRDSILIDGNSYMPCPTNSSSSEHGHHGNGYARISLLSNTSEINQFHQISCFFQYYPSFNAIIFLLLICGK